MTLNIATAELADAWPCTVDLPENHGAKRDGTTDDTAAIKAAISNAVSVAQANGTNYAEVWLSAGVYFVSVALDTSQLGRAQIPLPQVASTAQKFVLVLRCPSAAAPFPHWQQTSVQKAGATILTNLNASFDSGLGAASVIGGPTVQQLGSTDGGFSNMLVVIDGLSVVSNYTDPLHVGVDLQCIAECNIPSMAFSGNIVPGSFTTFPSAGGVALRMPQVGNNDNCEVGTLSIEGYANGLIPGEHTHVSRAGIVYCGSGVWFQGGQFDVARIDYLSTEACQDHLSTAGTVVSGSEMCQLDIGTWDIEDGTGSGASTRYHVNDANNYLTGGCLGVRRNNGSGAGAASDGKTGPGLPPIVNGSARAKWANGAQAPGAVAAPAVPATTAALTNPFWRDAAVTVGGSGLTGVQVDGESMSVVPGTYVVPSGKAITLTYIETPSWSWILL